MSLPIIGSRKSALGMAKSSLVHAHPIVRHSSCSLL
jgi:hypothetical protein